MHAVVNNSIQRTWNLFQGGLKLLTKKVKQSLFLITMEQLFQKKPLTNRMMMKMKGNNRKFNKLK